MWLSAEIYRVWSGCRNFPKRPPQRVAALRREYLTIFVGLIRPPSVEQVLFARCDVRLAIYGSLAQQRVVPMHWTALLICCWMGRDMLASRTLLENAWDILWPGNSCVAWICAACDMSPRIVTTYTHRNTIEVMTSCMSRDSENLLW